MCKVMENMRMKERKEVALRMLDDGTLPIEKIAQFTELSLNEVKKLEVRKTT